MSKFFDIITEEMIYNCEKSIISTEKKEECSEIRYETSSSSCVNFIFCTLLNYFL